MKTNAHFWYYLAEFFLEWEMFRTKVVDEVKTNILFQYLFSEKRVFYEKAEKYRTGKKWQYIMAQAHCILDN